MVNIYDKANEFERALRESDEYKASLAASEGLYSDEEANELYTQFVLKQKDLMEAAQSGNEPSEEDLTALEEIQQKLMENAKFLDFVQAQQKLQTELATNDPQKVETALVEFIKTVDETVKTLDAVEVKSPLVAAFKAKTKEVLTLSSSIVADSVKVMAQPTPESQNALAEKTQQLIQEGNVLQQLQAELQQTFGE